MEKLERLFKKSLEEVEDLGIKPSKKIYSIKINTRAKKRLGCCKKVAINMIPGFCLEIASHLMDGDEDKIKQVIIHEILHTCKGCFNHGEKWKQYAEKVNKAYGYCISRTADYDASEEVYRYAIVCKNCGNVIYRIRKSKVISNPDDYRCGKCKGLLEVKKHV